MSQHTPVSLTAPSHSASTTTAWIPARPSTGYEPLPYEDSEDHGDIKFGTLTLTSDVETGPTTSPSPPLAPEVHDTNTPAPRNCQIPSRTTLLRVGVLKVFVILLLAGLPSTLFFSLVAWLVGGAVLQAFEVPPYDAADLGVAFKASIAGAPVVALAVGALAFLDFVVRRLPRLRYRSHGAAYDQESDICVISCVCAPASVCAMPVGLLMMPQLGMETKFGVWHALGWSVTGLGVPLVGFGLGFLLPWMWCTTVHL